MRQPMKRGSLTSYGMAIAVLGFFLGGWLVFDGSLKLATGLYSGENTVGLGPWASVVSLLGVSPDQMAIPLVLLGILWLVNSALVIVGAQWRYERAILSGVLTLFYLIPGTIVSLVVILLSFRERRRPQRDK